MIVRAEIADQRVKTDQIRMILCIRKLIFIALHHWIYLCDLLKKVLDLLLVSLELAKLLVKIKDDPDGFFVEFLGILILAILGNHWNIVALFANQTQHFEDSDFCVFLSQQSGVFES